MRVLHIITSLAIGGAEVMLQKLVRATRPLGYESTVVSLTGTSTIGREMQQAGVRVVALGGRAGILLPQQFCSLARTFHHVRPQVVHCWMYHSNVVGHAVVRLKARSKRPALIVSVRTALDAGYEKHSRNIIRRLDARLSGAADAVVFNSQRGAEQHASLGYCMHRARVIPNFFDTDAFSPNPEAAARLRGSIGCGDALLVGLVARFDKSKDHRTFLLAGRAVMARHPDCRFLLAGRGCDESNEKLMQWVRECGLRDRVYMLGEVRDVPAVHAALDVAVSSSIREGFPNMVGEAMACAVPCVVTDVGDCKFVIGDGGFVVSPGNPDALAGGILSLLEMPAGERKRIGEQGRQRVITDFSTNVVLEKFTSLYDDACKNAYYRASVK